MYKYKNKTYGSLKDAVNKMKQESVGKKYYIYISKKGKYFVLSPKEV